PSTASDETRLYSRRPYPEPPHATARQSPRWRLQEPVARARCAPTRCLRLTQARRPSIVQVQVGWPPRGWSEEAGRSSLRLFVEARGAGHLHERGHVAVKVFTGGHSLAGLPE